MAGCGLGRVIAPAVSGSFRSPQVALTTPRQGIPLYARQLNHRFSRDFTLFRVKMANSAKILSDSPIRGSSNVRKRWS